MTATLEDLVAELPPDRERELYWEGKFRRLRIKPGDWCAMANRLAKTHDKNYGRRPPRRSKGPPFFAIAEIDRMIGEGKTLSNACSILLNNHKVRWSVRWTAKALSKAYTRHKSRVGQ
jgi:hypothetical protein